MASSYWRKFGNREKLVKRVISRAIEGQTCPICLKPLYDHKTAVITVCMHGYCLECIRKWSNLKRKCPLCNANFDSWFYNINLSSRNFLSHKLPPLTEGKSVIGRSRHELNSVSRRRTTPLPWRRSFGRPGSVPAHVVSERKLQWRLSVYNRHVQAVPLSLRNCLEQSVLGNNCAKERMRQRIEPWIQRELRAILGDLDTSIIAHVASSLFISSVEAMFSASSGGQLGVEDDFLAPLRPFLHDRTNMFWHELRCFAESSFTVETYDAVVEYK